MVFIAFTNEFLAQQFTSKYLTYRYVQECANDIYIYGSTAYKSRRWKTT